MAASALETLIEADATVHSESAIAAILADSDCDLGDADACVDVLVGAGIRPWQIADTLHWSAVVAEAHNERTWRAMRAAWLRNVNVPALLFTLVAGGMALLGLASRAFAAGAPTVSEHAARGIAITAAVTATGLIIGWLSTRGWRE